MQSLKKKTKEYSTVLFVFSGTGNSLKVALDIQENLDNCKILSISDTIKNENCEITASKIGFIFPVYFLDIPHIVREFLKKIKINGYPYIFAIATCGGEIGISFKSITKLLLSQNQKLNSEFKLVFPSNSIVMFDKSSTPNEIAVKIDETKVATSNIIDLIKKRANSYHTRTKAKFLDKVVSYSGKLFLFKILNDRKFRVDETKCKRCGICTAVCPMENIDLINGIPSWNHNCECCAACIHWCPQNAIENIKTRGKPQYHHPEITIKMIKSY